MSSAEAYPSDGLERADDTGASRRSTGVREIASAIALTALDMLSAIRTQRLAVARRSRAPLTASIVIARPPVEVYAFVRQLSQLPLVMDHLLSVRESDEVWSHWVARLPTGTVAWDVKLIEDLPGTLIEWRSVKGSVLELHGRAIFLAVREGATELRLELAVGAASHHRGRALATVFTAAQLTEDLRRLKRVLEEPGHASDAVAAPPPRPTAGAPQYRHGGAP